MPNEDQKIIRVDFRNKKRLPDAPDDRSPASQAPAAKSATGTKASNSEQTPVDLTAFPDANQWVSRPVYKQFSKWIEEGLVYVTFDPRRPGVSAPPQFAGQPKLTLSFSYLFQVPDFRFDRESVKATLSFGGVDQECVVPWKSVYQMRSKPLDESQTYPPNFPAELKLAMFGAGHSPKGSQPAKKGASARAAAPAKPAKPKLRVVPQPAATKSDASAPQSGPSTTGSAEAEALSGMTRKQLYALATERKIKGRSKMTKAQLTAALQDS